MSFDFIKGNNTAINLTNDYLNIKYGNLSVSVPYFINLAEQEYKLAMHNAGLSNENIKDVLNQIKGGNTAIGAHVGKGSPEEITKDVARMVERLNKLGYTLKVDFVLRSWMTHMHIGLDCSGYVYNIFKAIEKDQNIEILKLFNWVHPDTMKPSHAGAFIFDSDNLVDVLDTNLQVLDVLVMKDHSHIGILLEKENEMYLVDCSIGVSDGIAFFKVLIEDNTIVIHDNIPWTNNIKNNEVKIKRLPF